MQGSDFMTVNSDLGNPASNHSAFTWCNLFGQVNVTTGQIALIILRGVPD
jgi:hypothetical protein